MRACNYELCVGYGNSTREEEGRRHLMMEQEEKGKVLEDGGTAAIDITAMSSPVSAHSSGYSSADDDLISPKSASSHFCPFNPDEPLAAVDFDTHSFRGAEQLSLKPRLPNTDMPSMHTLNVDEFIDVDTIFDPLQPFLGAAGADDSDNLMLLSANNRSSDNLMLLSANNRSSDNLTGSLQSSPLSPHRLDASANRGLLLNSNFDTDSDMMDVEQSDAGSAAKCASNITINLPAGFNPKGQDGKSVLLDVLKKADKSQLLKIHEQINAAMASMSGSKGSGRSMSTRELQISITPAPTIRTMCQQQQLASQARLAVEQCVTHSPILSTGKDSHPALHPPSLSSSPMDTFQADNNTCALLSDVEAQFGAFDMMSDVANASFSESLLNDVNLGASVSTSNGSKVCPVTVRLPATTNSQVPSIESFQPAIYAAAHSSPKLNTCKEQSRACVSKPGDEAGLLAACAVGGGGVCAAACLCVQPHPHSIDMAAAVRGLDDHSYTSKCPSLVNTEHIKFANIKEGRAKNAPVLEHLLTTKRPVNPMKGSDHVAHGLQQLAINDMEALHGLNQPNLLKQLLTGEMDKKEGQIFHNGSIISRRGSNALTSSASSSHLAKSAAVSSQPTYEHFSDGSMLESLDMLGADPAAEVDCLWNAQKDSANWTSGCKADNDEIFGDIDELLHGESQSELDDILRQETRHEDEWMKQFLDGLL